MQLSKFNVIWALAIAVIAFVIDQLSKHYVTDILALHLGEVEEMIPGFVTFVYSKNCGINFGWGSSCLDIVQNLLAGFAGAVSLALLIWAARRWNDSIFAIGVGFIVGGALGNGFDRLVYGAVTDFLNVTCCGINNPFAFNIADVWIFGGVALLLLRTARDDRRTV